MPAFFVLSLLFLTVVAVAPLRAAVTFSEVAIESGIDAIHDPSGIEDDFDWQQNIYGPGVAWCDLNADGWPDLAYGGGPAGIRLFLNQADGTFRDVSDWMVSATGEPQSGLISVDLTGDGYSDFIAAHVYSQPWVFLSARERWVERARSSGLEPILPPESLSSNESMGLAFVDFDRDGQLDLASAHYHLQPDQLFRGAGGATFLRHLSLSPPRAMSGYGFQPLWWDFDSDGDFDLYMVNDFGINHLWENGGASSNWALTEMARPYRISGIDVSNTLPDAPKNWSMGVAAGDYDNDLDPDLYITNWAQNSLYTNLGSGGLGWGFRDDATLKGVDYAKNCWGTGFGDLDLDGDLDLVVVGGWVFEDGPAAQDFEIANKVYLNNGAPNYDFTDITTPGVADSLQYGRGFAMADYDRDGDLDYAVGNGSLWFPTQTHPDRVLQEGHLRLYRNDQNEGGHWVAARLRGTGNCHASAAGARLYVETSEGARQMRTLHYGSSFLSQDEAVLHVGIGASTSLAEMSVRWPCGNTEIFSGAGVDQYFELVEGEGNVRPWVPALSSLNAAYAEGRMSLQWQSAPWLGAPSFMVERALAGSELFEPLEIEVVVIGDGLYGAMDDSTEAETDYIYRVGVEDGSGPAFSSMVVPARSGSPDPPAPNEAALFQNRPNPFLATDGTIIQLDLPTEAKVSIHLYDLRGRKLRTLFTGSAAAGSLMVPWDGRDGSGNRLAAGQYVYVLDAPWGNEAKRLTLRH